MIDLPTLESEDRVWTSINPDEIGIKAQARRFGPAPCALQLRRRPARPAARWARPEQDLANGIWRLHLRFVASAETSFALWRIWLLLTSAPGLLSHPPSLVSHCLTRCLHISTKIVRQIRPMDLFHSVRAAAP